MLNNKMMMICKKMIKMMIKIFQDKFMILKIVKIYNLDHKVVRPINHNKNNLILNQAALLNILYQIDQLLRLIYLNKIYKLAQEEL